VVVLRGRSLLLLRHSSGNTPVQARFQRSHGPALRARAFCIRSLCPRTPQHHHTTSHYVCGLTPLSLLLSLPHTHTRTPSLMRLSLSLYVQRVFDNIHPPVVRANYSYLNLNPSFLHCEVCQLPRKFDKAPNMGDYSFFFSRRCMTEYSSHI
jgi:hypothetical protein